MCELRFGGAAGAMVRRRSSSWLWANACATRSKRMERAVNGEAAPPELESPVVDIPPCSSSREASLESTGKLSYKENKIGKYPFV